MNVDYIAIGQRIAARRKELHLTQADLAEKVDLSVQHISGIETASSVPSLEAVMRICFALNIFSDYILFGLIDKTPNSLIVEIIRHILASNPQELENILRHIETM